MPRQRRVISEMPSRKKQKAVLGAITLGTPLVTSCSSLERNSQELMPVGDARNISASRMIPHTETSMPGMIATLSESDGRRTKRKKETTESPKVTAVTGFIATVSGIRLLNISWSNIHPAMTIQHITNTTQAKKKASSLKRDVKLCM
jgi:hypothetical protein